MSQDPSKDSKEDNLFDMIRSFTSIYIGVVQKNPHLPRFIVNELGKNPERLLELISSSQNAELKKTFQNSVREAAMRGEIIEVDADQLFANMISC